MKTRALAIVALSLGLIQCAGNNASVELARICTHPTPTTGGCLYPATCDVGQLLNQSVDLGVSPGVNGSDLWTPIQVNNQLPNNADTSIGRLNTNDAFIQEARLSYQVPVVSVPDVTIAMGPQLVPAGGSAVLLFPIVPVTVGALLGASGIVSATPIEITVTLKAAGRFSDDSTFVTAEYKIPVEVCSGCMPASLTCTAPAVGVCCPQFGQTNSCACVTP